ncbi:MAG: DUF2256 domain-containing protein [Armatimonadota bacterium]
MGADRPCVPRADRVTRKENLPTKDCAACGRPFAWRKKWERCWDEVRFCSDRCRGVGKRQASTGNGSNSSTNA